MEINLSNFAYFKDLISFLRSSPSEIYFEGELLSAYGKIVMDYSELKSLYRASC